MRTILAALVVTGGPLGCGGSAFVCRADEQCSRAGTAGVCQPNGYCSFADDACASGQRYGEHAGNGLAGACVDEQGGEDEAAGSTTTNPGAESDETTGTPQPGTTSSSSTSSSTSSSGGNPDDDSTSSPTTSVLMTDDGVLDDGVTDDGVTDDGVVDDGVVDDGADTEAPPEPCSFVDDFDDDTLLHTGGPLAFFVQDGMLGAEIQSTSKYGWAWSDPMDLTDRFIVAEIGSPPPPAGDAQLLIELSTDPKHTMLIEGSELMARTGWEDNSYVTHALVPFDADEHRYVRVGHEGDMIHFGYSPDGVAWTSLYALEVDEEDLTSANLAIVIGTWKDETDLGFVGVESISVCP